MIVKLLFLLYSARNDSFCVYLNVQLYHNITPLISLYTNGKKQNVNERNASKQYRTKVIMKVYRTKPPSLLLIAPGYLKLLKYKRQPIFFKFKRGLFEFSLKFSVLLRATMNTSIFIYENFSSFI